MPNREIDFDVVREIALALPGVEVIVRFASIDRKALQHLLEKAGAPQESDE